MDLIETTKYSNPKLLKFIQQGWKFWIDFDESPHNGDISTNFYFQSPRMTNHASCNGMLLEYTPDFFDPELLLKAELWAMARQHTDDIDRLLNDLSECLRKDFLGQLERAYKKESAPKIKLPKKLTATFKIVKQTILRKKLDAGKFIRFQANEVPFEDAFTEVEKQAIHVAIVRAASRQTAHSQVYKDLLKLG